MGKVIYADNAGKVKIPASVVFPDATEQTTKGHPMRWTLNKLLKGAGAGADPTEIDPITIATGTYTGNETGRQVTTGFKCSLVIIITVTGIVHGTIIPNAAYSNSSVTSGVIPTASLHASNGFSLTASSISTNLNKNTVVYYYWAISE